MLMLSIVFQAFLVLLLADFVAGIVHWAQDAYIRSDTPILGKIGRANTVHHHYPRHFTRFNWWYTSWQTLALAAILILIAWMTGYLCWQVWWFAFLSTNANQIHKFAHMTRKEKGPIISFLQATHLLVTPRHHGIHHVSPKQIRYCPITNLLNPILDKIHFWVGAEWAMFYMFGIIRREDTSVTGTMPQWVKESVNHKKALPFSEELFKN